MDIKNEKADIKENNILNIDPIILSILLKDRTTSKNIIWATDNYKSKGFRYRENDSIEIELITGKNGNTIKPRIEKNKKEQQSRARDKAEVFTPSWVCNAQNNLIDEAWFGRKDVFNTEIDNGWKSNKEKIIFPENKKWQDYVQDTRLEISCGEAPYIVSRYDTVTGKVIKIKDRIGLLDRKLRIIDENTETKEEWLKWAEIAFKNVYGYDWQGDNVLIARENLLFTLIDYYKEKFKEEVDKPTLIMFAEIISWNIWQMDGLKFVVPNSCKNKTIEQISFFGKVVQGIKCVGCESRNPLKHNGKQCKIMDWKRNKKVKYVSLIGG